MSGILRADVLTLKNGHKVDCINVKINGLQATITHENGKISLPSNMISKVESGSLAVIRS